MSKTPSAIRTIGAIGKRIYAFILVGVLLYVFYLAVSYLVVTVFYPAPVPERLLASPGLLGVEQLRAQTIPGAPAGPARTPMSHYHEAGPPMLADRSNGCTISGCHEPLPHSRSVYVRSFANLHSTFLTCQMCHAPVEQKPVKAAWVSTTTGLVTEPPALVQLMKMFQTQRQQIEASPAAANDGILALLAQVVEISQDPLLRYLYLEISTAEPGSPVWRDAVIRLDQQLASQTRGEYGAKIAPVAAADSYLRESEKMREGARPILAASTQSAEYTRLNDELHKDILPKPDRCTMCHGETPPLVDFVALGYSPQRAEFLRTNPVARQVQDVREGRQFYLPSITEERR
jgi:hypothetical protein